jgi:hypothetical protein
MKRHLVHLIIQEFPVFCIGHMLIAVFVLLFHCNEGAEFASDLELHTQTDSLTFNELAEATFVLLL